MGPESEQLKVLFLPDYRPGNPYQQHLADALGKEGVSVKFPVGERRAMPLWRGVGEYDPDIVHIHWPEKYYQRRGDGADFLRKLRYPLDLRMALGRRPLVFTAHDLAPHNRGGELLVKRNYQCTFNHAGAVFVHSESARGILTKAYHINERKFCVIPHGDMVDAPLSPRALAREQLGLSPGERLCVMFGRVEPYKGIEPVIQWWRSREPDAVLAVVGIPLSEEYASHIHRLSAGARGVLLRLEWQPRGDLLKWLAAANCVLFNYSTILTSGAASEARSYGLPILLPTRLGVIDLDEPSPLVFRFDDLDTDFHHQLSRALTAERDFDAASGWRAERTWQQVAKRTAQIYHSLHVPKSAP